MQHRPAGFSTITPYLILEGAADFIAFAKRAFGADELGRTTDEHGKIRHSVLRIGDSILEVSDASPKWRTGLVGFHLYVEDAAAVYAAALDAGASVLYELSVKSYGDLEGGVVDPWGHHWYIGTHRGSWTEHS